jgi:hypothetical protein
MVLSGQGNLADQGAGWSRLGLPVLPIERTVKLDCEANVIGTGRRGFDQFLYESNCLRSQPEKRG